METFPCIFEQTRNNRLRNSMDTTIDQIESWACSLPLDRPLRFGHFEVKSREYVALRVRTKGGLVADCVGQTRKAPVDVAILDVLAPAIMGEDAMDIPARTADLTGALRALERDGVFSRGLSLLEICLQDLKAQAAGRPLWRVYRESAEPLDVLLVEGYEIAPEGDEAFADRLLSRSEQGFRFMKLEAAHYPDVDSLRRRVAAIRRRVGESLRMVLDFAWSWPSVEHGLRIATALREFNIEWLEDPFSRDRVEDYAGLKAAAELPIGAGDEATRPEQMLRLIEADAVDVVRVDAHTLGGFGPAHEVAKRAAARGLRVSLHERPEIHQHGAFGWGCSDHVEVFPTDRPFDRAHDLIREPVFDRIVDGRIEPPQQPGTGLKLNDEAVTRWARRSSCLS
jgi:L-alanine-DL-glutamate epimerase-like enolase superfamily enzyme